MKPCSECLGKGIQFHMFGVKDCVNCEGTGEVEESDLKYSDENILDRIEEDSMGNHAYHILRSLQVSNGLDPADKAIFRVLENIFGRDDAIDAFRQYYKRKDNDRREL